jgi:DNA recombination protein RmuC
MLEESGLRKGEEYFTQENHKTEDGRDVRPDVIIRFPDKRCVVVDSKVSLTAYAMYCGAEKEEERQLYIGQHVASVRKHINELATKDYSSVVEDTISYVLMFMPNEASYMAALQACNDLQMEAYRRRVILISPTNLLMALQLAYNLWQKERQSRNVQNIISRAEALYKKCVTVCGSVDKMKRAIDALNSAYEQAESQFRSGRGSLCRQISQLSELGIAPARKLELEDAPDVEEDDAAVSN